MADTPNEKPLTTGEWVVTLLVLMIPLVNFVMYFVWAFTDGNISRRNFCRAQLLIIAIVLALAMVVGVAALLFTGALAGLSGMHH